MRMMSFTPEEESVSTTGQSSTFTLQLDSTPWWVPFSKSALPMTEVPIAVGAARSEDRQSYVQQSALFFFKKIQYVCKYLE